MRKCESCGSTLEPGVTVCPTCGTTNYGVSATDPNDTGGFLWGLLGCCIPIVGLILFLVWKDQKPNTAKAAGLGALVSVILAVIYYIVVFALGIGLSIL